MDSYWEPRWHFRVARPDGSIVYEGGNIALAENASNAQGFPVEQMYEKAEYEWRQR